MRIQKFIVAVAVLAALPVAAHAQDSITVTTTDTATTITITAPPVDLVEQARVLALIQRRANSIASPARSGFIAEYPDGSPLWRTRANTPLMPASTMKVVTAAIALRVLGPDWKPITRVTLDTSTGTLALVGGGDALLTTSQLQALARATVETLTATASAPTLLVVDDTLFPSPRLQDGVSPGQQPSEERPIRALVVDRRKTADSSLDAGRRFRDMLAGQGVQVRLHGHAKSTGAQIAAVSGLRLQSSLKTMLIYSDNDIAEMTFRLSAIGAGRNASWADARETAYSTLTDIGVSTKHLQLIDGSGLSRNNRLTPFALAELLARAAADERMAVLRTLLPTAGVDGTLRRRYLSGPAQCVQGLLQAKTGSLHDVIALAGYAPADDGTARPFAMIVNGVRNSAVARNSTRAGLDLLAAAFSGC